MLGSESPYRKLPSSLDRRQFAYLVSIRYCAQIVDLSYRMLVSSLKHLAVSSARGEGLADDAITAALVGAWNVVDSANRLRLVLEGMPGMQKSDAPMQLILRKLRTAEALRHPIQHINREIQRHDTNTDLLVWGSLRWAEVNREDGTGASYVLVPGSLRNPDRIDAINPAGRGFRNSIDLVTLDAFGASVEISEIAHAIAELIEHTEPSLAKQFDGHETVAADLLLAMHLAFDEHGANNDDPAGGP